MLNKMAKYSKFDGKNRPTIAARPVKSNVVENYNLVFKSYMIHFLCPLALEIRNVYQILV
jgi:hypothetical protein